MSRKTLGAVLILLAAIPLRAQDAPGGQDQKGPALVSAGAVQADADQLHDAVASPSNDNFSVHAGASAFFDGILSRTPTVLPSRTPMDREPVDGRVGTVKGMLEAAQKRWEDYKLTTTEVPDAKLSAAIDYAKEMNDQKRVALDPKLAENDMGAFVYSKDGKTDLGAIKLNPILTLIATRLGEPFIYATLVHEAAHAKARSEGRLDPAHTTDNEVEAYRVQFLWLKVIDPKEERITVLWNQLALQLKAHPEDKLSRSAFSYVTHLLQLWDTNGEDLKLKEFVKNLGYRDGEGVDPSATGLRA
jgi:hypothetical protein